MRNLLLSALILASAYQTALGQTYTSGPWTYSVENNQATITDYTGAGRTLSIPYTLNFYPVVSIGSAAFVSSALTSVIIPNSVTSIGDSAFSYCASLTSVIIPNSVTSIGDSAFSYCTSLTTLTIPNSVTSIADGAFAGCTGLTTFTIPNSVTRIAGGAFAGCTGLTTFTIPSSVTSIGDGAFAGCTSLNIVVILSTQTVVGANAFPASTAVLYANQLTPLALDPTFGTALASNSAFVTALANNPAFVFALVNSIKETSDNYGFATQSGVSSAISTAVQPLATKSELTSSLTQSRTDGINSVLSNPNLWTLYTTSQIQNMAVGDLVLTRQVSGGFVLNYDIEQSTDLQTWTPYQALSLPLTGLPTDKAFVRIKAKQ